MDYNRNQNAKKSFLSSKTCGQAVCKLKKISDFICERAAAN